MLNTCCSIVFSTRFSIILILSSLCDITGGIMSAKYIKGYTYRLAQEEDMAALQVKENQCRLLVNPKHDTSLHCWSVQSQSCLLAPVPRG